MPPWVSIPGLTDDTGLIAVWSEIMNTTSDRATAIVAGSFVEMHLEYYIKSRLTANDRIQKEMFSPGRALGDFGVKINLAALMSLISDDARKELDAIRTIRNNFAHEPHIQRFSDQSIRARCDNLSIWKTIRVKGIKDTFGYKMKMGPLSTAEIEALEVKGYIDFVFDTPPQSACDKYIAACRFYIIACICVTGVEYQKPAVWF